MAAAGLQIPAGEGTKIPFYRTVLADIGDEQDLSQSLSTFSSHLSRISEIIQDADPMTLVLMDELGSGTDPLEGEALGRAILRHLLDRKVKVLVSTHLSKLKEFAFSSPRVENACMEFDPDSLRPTFHLRIGIPGESNAIRIAKRLGIPHPILEEARAALDISDRDLKELMDDVQRVRIQAEHSLERTQRDARAVEELKARTREREKEIAFKASVLQQEAEREIDECLRRGRDRAMVLLKKLKNLPVPEKKWVDELEQALIGMVKRSPLAVKRRQFVEGLKKGDLVYIPRYREQCRVIKVLKKEDRIEVAYKNLSVKVPSEEVIWPHWIHFDG
jgi:DNA mismatch repair protein MutS2